QERQIRSNGDWTETEQDQNGSLNPARQPVIDRVDAGGRQPIEIDRAMVDSVKSPHPAAVKPPVRPIADEVTNENHFDGLQPESLAGQQGLSCVQHYLDIVDISPIQQDQNERHTDLRY